MGYEFDQHPAESIADANHDAIAMIMEPVGTKATGHAAIVAGGLVANNSLFRRLTSRQGYPPFRAELFTVHYWWRGQLQHRLSRRDGLLILPQLFIRVLKLRTRGQSSVLRGRIDFGKVPQRRCQ